MIHFLAISLSNLTVLAHTFTYTNLLGSLNLASYILQDKTLAKSVSSEKAVKWFLKIINRVNMEPAIPFSYIVKQE